jgi:hypothetical protein
MLFGKPQATPVFYVSSCLGIAEAGTINQVQQSLRPPIRKRKANLSAILAGVLAANITGQGLVYLAPWMGLSASETMTIWLRSAAAVVGGFATAAMARRAQINNALLTGYVLAGVHILAAAWLVLRLRTLVPDLEVVQMAALLLRLLSVSPWVCLVGGAIPLAAAGGYLHAVLVRWMRSRKG